MKKQVNRNKVFKLRLWAIKHLILYIDDTLNRTIVDEENIEDIETEKSIKNKLQLYY